MSPEPTTEPVSTNVDTDDEVSPMGDTAITESGHSDEPDTFDRAYVTELREEAAQHRVRARDLEAEVGTLRERLLEDNVRHLVADVLADPADLLTFHDPEALVDDDGLPDPDAILAAARELARERPHLVSRRPAGPIEQGPRDEPATVDLAGMLRTRAG